jgi:hypothetical protein
MKRGHAPFDYTLDFDTVDFRQRPDRKGEQGCY